jgi:hypothetical protein
MMKIILVLTLTALGAIGLTQAGTLNAIKTLGRYTHPLHYHHVAKVHAYGQAAPNDLRYSNHLAYGQAYVPNYNYNQTSGSCVNGGHTAWGYVGCDPDPRVQFELNRDQSWLHSRD